MNVKLNDSPMPLGKTKIRKDLSDLDVKLLPPDSYYSVEADLSKQTDYKIVVPDTLTDTAEMSITFKNLSAIGNYVEGSIVVQNDSDYQLAVESAGKFMSYQPAKTLSVYPFTVADGEVHLTPTTNSIFSDKIIVTVPHDEPTITDALKKYGQVQADTLMIMLDNKLPDEFVWDFEGWTLDGNTSVMIAPKYDTLPNPKVVFYTESQNTIEQTFRNLTLDHLDFTVQAPNYTTNGYGFALNFYCRSGLIRLNRCNTYGNSGTLKMTINTHSTLFDEYSNLINVYFGAYESSLLNFVGTSDTIVYDATVGASDAGVEAWNSHLRTTNGATFRFDPSTTKKKGQLVLLTEGAWNSIAGALTLENANTAITVGRNSHFDVDNVVFNNCDTNLNMMGEVGQVNRINKLGAYIIDKPSGGLNVASYEGGTTAERPVDPRQFFNYFDTDLAKPIWFNGTEWVDATGTAV